MKELDQTQLNINYVKKQLRFNYDALKQIVIFSENEIEKVGTIIDSLVSTNNIIHAISKMCHLITYMVSTNWSRILSANIFKQFDGHITKSNEVVQQNIINNITNMDLTKFRFRTNADENYYSASDEEDDAIPPFEYNTVERQDEFKEKCILITNWIFDCAKDVNHVANSYTTYELIKLLLAVIEYFTKINDEVSYGYEHFVKKPLLKNIFTTELIAVTTSFGELRNMILNKHKFLTDSNIIYNCNCSTESDSYTQQYIETVVYSIDCAINSLSNRNGFKQFNEKLVKQTIKDLVNVQMKYFCEQKDVNLIKPIKMFDVRLSAIEYFLSSDFTDLCIHRDYVVFKEKLLLVFVHDRLFGGWGEGEGVPMFSEKMLADDAIVYQIVKFQQ